MHMYVIAFGTTDGTQVERKEHVLYTRRRQAFITDRCVELRRCHAPT